jgi:hypothetical protein
LIPLATYKSGMAVIGASFRLKYIAMASNTSFKIYWGFLLAFI